MSRCRCFRWGVEGEVRIWDVATGSELHTLKGHYTGVSALAFSPKERTLVSGGTDGSRKTWHVATGQDMITWKFPEGTVADVAFVDNGDAIEVKFADSFATKVLRAANWKDVFGQFFIVTSRNVNKDEVATDTMAICMDAFDIQYPGPPCARSTNARPDAV